MSHRERVREWADGRSVDGRAGGVVGNAEGDLRLVLSPSARLMAARNVGTRWRQKTDLDMQNALLLFCCYSVFAMLLAATIALLALLNDGHLKGHVALLLLLLHGLLSYSQGAVLFLAFGLHWGLVAPMVAVREWWRQQRIDLFGDSPSSPLSENQWQYFSPEDYSYMLPQLPRGWSQDQSHLQLFSRDWEMYHRDDAESARDWYPSYPIDEGDEDTVLSTATCETDNRTIEEDEETVVEVSEDSVF